jgi:hypothetical protein
MGVTHWAYSGEGLSNVVKMFKCAKDMLKPRSSLQNLTKESSLQVHSLFFGVTFRCLDAMSWPCHTTLLNACR